MISSLLRRVLPAACLGLLLPIADPLSAQSPGSIDFFESRIRPVLVERCYECHSSEADEIGGSLVLDSRDGMMGGGDSGPAIDPGNVEGSVLIAAIRYESSEMPPDGRLPENVVRDFEQWIAAGAVDPRHGKAPPPDLVGGVDLEQGRKFWAFQPLHATSPVSKAFSGSEAMTPAGPIDRYLNQSLAEAGIRANDLADPETQLRRLCFDLTGLPPSLEMQDRWLADSSSQNWSRIVDQLLATRAFGEHWARHWMDVARYADSNGSDFNATYHEAWRYRDYLIRSFGSDRPLDQMIREQVAGDLLPHENDQQRYDQVVATTFLMLGPKMLSERDKEKLVMDVVDEQIDTIGRAFLGLTLGCARCHDHKFDPVPTEDYYALAGIFKSTLTLNGESQKYVSTWNRVPLPTSDQHRRQVAAHEQDVRSLEAEIKQSEQELKRLRQGDPKTLPGIVVDDQNAEKIGAWKSSVYFKHYVGEGYVHDDNSGKGDASIRYQVRLPKPGKYEVRISHSPGSNRASAVPISLQTADGEVTLSMDQRQVQIEPMWSSLGVFEFAADSDTVLTIRNAGTSGYVIADAVQFLPEGKDNASAGPDAERIKLAEQAVKQLKQQLAELKQNAPPPLPEAMAPTDRPTNQIADSAVHIRGEVRNRGPLVPRGFLQVCSSGDASIRRAQGSGRMELADWLTDPDNPLVSRVFVNRVWMHLMGEGLVRTVDNFGTQGERPTHPDLLDHLAIEFVRKGWHLKSLVRQIVTTQAYRRSSAFDPQANELDPENRLLWRMPRRRLPAEAIRDAMIAASGRLDRTPQVQPMRGRGVLVSSNNSDSNARFDDVALPYRSLYLPVVRGYMPDLMVALDMADPDLLMGRRPTTNVPSQALVLINSPEVNDWALATAERIVDQADGLESRLELALRILLQRRPSSQDLATARDFFRDRESSVEAWHQYVSATYAAAPFRFLD